MKESWHINNKGHLEEITEEGADFLGRIEKRQVFKKVDGCYFSGTLGSVGLPPPKGDPLRTHWLEGLSDSYPAMEYKHKVNI